MLSQFRDLKAPVKLLEGRGVRHYTGLIPRTNRVDLVLPIQLRLRYLPPPQAFRHQTLHQPRQPPPLRRTQLHRFRKIVKKYDEAVRNPAYLEGNRGLYWPEPEM